MEKVNKYIHWTTMSSTVRFHGSRVLNKQGVTPIKYDFHCSAYLGLWLLALQFSRKT